jgi:polyhydroxyalkanoate synthesis regulator phasin
MGEESPRQYGFLAEDMAENIDGQSYVVYNEDGTPEAIQYSRLVVPLHSAMRKLRSRIDELESRLAELESNA